MSKVVQEGELKLHLGTAFLYENSQIALESFSGRMEISMKKGTFMNEKSG